MTLLLNVAIPVTFKSFSVPNCSNAELTTPAPRPFAEITPVPLILYLLPDARSKCSLDFNASDEFSYLINFLIPTEPIPIPAPSNNAFVNAVDAIPTTKSPNSISPVLTEIVEPSTYKSPLILTLPVLTPTPAGSIVTVSYTHLTLPTKRIV